MKTSDRTKQFRVKNARRKAAKKLGKVHVRENRIQGRLLALNLWQQRAAEARKERERSELVAGGWTDHRRRDEERLLRGEQDFCSLPRNKCHADPARNRAPLPMKALGVINRRDVRQHCMR